MRAGCDLKAGDHLSIMYSHSLWGTWARRDHLATNKRFWCACERCRYSLLGLAAGGLAFTGDALYFRDPTELGSHFSTVIGKNGVNLSCRNPLDQSSPWVGKDAEADEEVSIEAEVIQDDMARIGAELAMLQISRSMP